MKWAVIVGTLAAGVGGVYGAAATLNFDLDRPVWKSEHDQLAGLSLAYILERREARLFHVERQIRKYTSAPPDELLRERRWLIREIARLKALLGLK